MQPARLIKVFRLIDHLTDCPEGRSVSEVSKQLGFPLSSTHDLLQTMVAAGILACVGKRYSLGPLSLALGIRLAEAVDVRRLCRAHLINLRDRLEDDVYLAVGSGRAVMYVDHYRGTRGVTVSVPLGRPLFLHSTAVGKLYAAHDAALLQVAVDRGLTRRTAFTITDRRRFDQELATIRLEGVSISRQESFDGVVGVAVPVFDGPGHLKAAIHVSTLVSSILEDRLKSIVAELKETARLITLDLSGRFIAEAPPVAHPAG